MTNLEATPYVLLKGGYFFNWNEFLAKSRRTWGEWQSAAFKAQSWVTCACGELCNVIPRDSLGVPLDGQLCQLGMKFTQAIGAHRAADARRVLLDIEKRSAELIQKLITHGQETQQTP